MIAPASPSTKPTMTVANPDVRPSDEWVRCVARLLLADVDREFEETQQMEKAVDGHDTGDG